MRALIIKLRNAIHAGMVEEANLMASLNAEQRHMLNMYKLVNDL